MIIKQSIRLRNFGGEKNIFFLRLWGIGGKKFSQEQLQGNFLFIAKLKKKMFN